MSAISLEKLKPAASTKVQPFLEEILSAYRERIHSIYITGSAITEDFHEDRSDVNSIIVLKKMDLKFLELLAPLGKKYAKRRVAAPLIMTPEYIESSLDVFPIEFLNFKLIHKTVFGEDVFDAIQVGRRDLRHQCERELKVKLIWLRQGYLASLGDRKLLTESFVNSITGYIPLFRGIIFLLGGEPPAGQADVISALAKTAHISTDVFARVLREKKERIKLSLVELNTIFEDYYNTTEKRGKRVDEITI
jgi:predicted nucleotidyltransferase